MPIFYSNPGRGVVVGLAWSHNHVVVRDLRRPAERLRRLEHAPRRVARALGVLREPLATARVLLEHVERVGRRRVLPEDVRRACRLRCQRAELVGAHRREELGAARWRDVQRDVKAEDAASGVRAGAEPGISRRVLDVEGHHRVLGEGVGAGERLPIQKVRRLGVRLEAGTAAVLLEEVEGVGRLLVFAVEVGDG
jgi:hypothetical protein